MPDNNLKWSSKRKAPKGEEDRNDAVEESSTCEMGMQVSCCDPAEISEKSPVWEVAAQSWRNSQGTVPSERNRSGRGQSYGGSHTYAA